MAVDCKLFMSRERSIRRQFRVTTYPIAIVLMFSSDHGRVAQPPCDFTLAISYNIEAETGQRERAQQAKSVHVSQQVEAPIDQQQHGYRDECYQGNRVVRRPT